VTIRELARLARLSPAAVSLALRDNPKVSAATRRRVQRLAAKAGYQPDARMAAMMSYLRKPRSARQTACFGVISFYDQLRPWQRSIHYTRVYEGMLQRARSLGYRLEPLWLKAPGMTLRRFRGILETRGIEGLLCFGSPDLDQIYPKELDVCAVVTQGLSIRTPLHRVMNHAYNDTITALNRLKRLGYRRPGLVLGHYEDLRSAHAHSAAFLGWCEYHLSLSQTVPVLRINEVEPEPLLDWLKDHRPDALIFVHLHDVLKDFRAVLQRSQIRVPRDLGVLVISPYLEDSGFDGLQENQAQQGAWAVEMLAARIANRDFGIPPQPHVEMVESCWVAGHSLQASGPGSVNS
jgi:LacI family transcriptional regulator